MADRQAHLSDPDLYRLFYDVDQHPGQIFSMTADEPRLRWALEAIGPTSDVIDLGCHKGEMTFELYPHTRGRLVGVEISHRAIREAKSYSAWKGYPIEWIEADVAAVPLPDNTFDVAILAEVLEHVPDPAAVLQEAERLVRPGGHIVLSVPINALAIDAQDAVQRDRISGLALDMHVREYDPATACAGKTALQTREEWVRGFGFRLARYEVAK